MRSSTSLLVRRDCAQIEDAQYEIGDRRGDQRAFVGDRVRNETRRALRAAEHRRDVRRVEIDVRRHHGDIARFERGIVFEQRAQLIVQHFDFAQARVAGVHLQRALALDRGERNLRTARRAALEQIELQALQQAMRFFGFGVELDLARRHQLVREQRLDEVATGAAPRREQRIFRIVERIGVGVGEALAQCLQIAPVSARRRRQIEMHGAAARGGGHHAQHIRRHVEAREREDARRQSARRRRVGVAVQREEAVDRLRTMASGRASRAARARPASRRARRRDPRRAASRGARPGIWRTRRRARSRATTP